MFIAIISFIVILGLLIFVHELGHFVTAKKSGVKVDEFGFGYPPRIWGFKKGETLYSINWIPVGGFVKIKGQDGEDKESEDSFAHKPFRSRALILSAGVLMNVFLAFIILSVGFMFGLPAALDGESSQTAKISDPKVLIASVATDSAAAEAGLKPADQVFKVGDLEVETVEELQNYIKEHSEEAIKLTIKDDTGVEEIMVQPREVEGFTQGKVLGVTLIKTGIVRYNFFESWYRGALVTWNLLVAIIFAFYDLFKNLFTGAGLSVDISGPVGVAVMAGRMADLGWNYILQFTAILSLNLAILNFLPFPALDGGRFIFLLVEKIRRKPINQNVENAVHTIGFGILMILVVVVTYRDVIRYGSNMIDKIKDLF